MGVHNNAHVPKESFPSFIWYVIEFLIVIGVSIGIAMNTIGYFTKMGLKEDMTNWIFWSIVGVVFVVYYLVIRAYVLKRPVLSKL